MIKIKNGYADYSAKKLELDEDQFIMVRPLRQEFYTQFLVKMSDKTTAGVLPEEMKADFVNKHITGWMLYDIDGEVVPYSKKNAIEVFATTDDDGDNSALFIDAFNFSLSESRLMKEAIDSKIEESEEEAKK